MDKPSAKYFSTTVTQKVAASTAIVFSFAAAVMIFAFAVDSDTTELFMGGLNWSDNLFNWHPVFMTWGLIFFFVTALVSFRLFPFDKVTTKYIHMICHSLAICCIVIGLTAVLVHHDWPSNGIYFPNFYSLHSMIGITAVAIYSQNYWLGLLAYYFPNVMSMEFKKNYMPSHVLFGLFSFYLSAFSVVTGISEYTTEHGCSYTVTSADWNPASNYHLLPTGCQVANGVGILVLGVTFLVTVAVYDVNLFNNSLQQGNRTKSYNTGNDTTPNILTSGI